jgi:hypothetical protein
MKKTKQHFFVTAIALLFSISYTYPQLVCDSLLGFETVARDTFGVNYDIAGDLIFTESSIDVYIDSILWTSGSKGYFWAYLDTALCEFGFDKTIRFNNVSLIFDITSVNTNGVSFNFLDMGGEENLQVNGGQVHVVGNFMMLPPDIAPGVSCIVDSMPAEVCDYGFVGRVNLTGPVNTLLIAGQELWIDSVCIDDIVTSLPEDSYQPKEFTLKQNYPNPFSLSTEISYTILEPGFVSLKVYDIHGREIRELVNEHQARNSYTVIFNGENLTGGVYYYKLQVNDVTVIRKMLLVR